MGTRRLKVAVLSLLAAMAAAELATRFFLAFLASDPVFVRYASAEQLKSRYGASIYSPHRYLNYVGTPGYRRGSNYHNSLGFRGEEVALRKPPGVYRIVCLGGSTTYCNATDDPAKAYPAQLETYLRAQGLNVEVVNAGVPGYTSLESLINLQIRVLELSPDLIIVYHGVNDVHTRLVWPPSAYKRDLSGYLSTNRFLNMPPIWEYSSVIRSALVHFGAIEPHSSLTRSLGGFPDSSYAVRFWKQVRDGTYPAGFFRTVSVMQMLRTNRPQYFRENLSDIVEVAKRHGTQTLLSTFAYSTDFDQPYTRTPEYQFALSEHNTVVRQVAESTGADFLDFASLELGRSLFADGLHLTEEGNRFRAKIVGDFILEKDLIEGRRQKERR